MELIRKFLNKDVFGIDEDEKYPLPILRWSIDDSLVPVRITEEQLYDKKPDSIKQAQIKQLYAEQNQQDMQRKYNESVLKTHAAERSQKRAEDTLAFMKKLPVYIFIIGIGIFQFKQYMLVS